MTSWDVIHFRFPSHLPTVLCVFRKGLGMKEKGGGGMLGYSPAVAKSIIW